MRFCFIAPGYRSIDVLKGDTRESGGAEAQVACLATALGDSGHQVEMIYGYGNAPTATSVIAGVRCIDACPSWRYPGSLFSFWTALEESAAELIYARQPDDFLWILGLFSKLHPRTKFLYALANDRNCNPWQYYTYNKWFHSPLYAVGLRSADVVAVQHGGQVRMVRPYTNAEVALVPNLVRSFRDKPRMYAETDIDVIWVATIRPRKQLQVFLDVVEQLPDLQFVVVGGFSPTLDRKSRSGLEERMKTLENLRFFGPQRFQEVIQLLTRSKILVNTSKWEGFPNTMLEAWSVGVPVVSLEIDPGGVIHRETIGLVSGTVPKMIGDIDRLVRTHLLNCRMGERGWKYVRRTHSLGAVVRAFERIMPSLRAQNGAVREGGGS